MFKNYLFIAIRRALNTKFYSVISLIGLTIGISVTFIIFFFVKSELSYDTFHEKANRIYRVAALYKQSDKAFARIPPAWGPSLNNDFNEVSAYVRLSPAQPAILTGKKSFADDRFYYTDSDFFDIFSFNFIFGNPETALSAPNSVVLTKSAAQKYFGHINVIGSALSIIEAGSARVYSVTGVIENPPWNSTIKFNLLATYPDPRSLDTNWRGTHSYTFILLNHLNNVDLVKEKLPEYLERMGRAEDISLILQPLTSIHLHSHFEREMGSNGDIKYIYAFSLIGILILVVSSFNFINLKSAEAVTRCREVGTRKALGGHRYQLALQFLAETNLIVIISTILAIFSVASILPIFNQILNLEIQIHYTWGSVLGLFGLTMVVSMLAGLYPAFYLSSLQPVIALRGGAFRGKPNKTYNQALVFIQFTIAAIVTAAAFIATDQIKYISEKDLGLSPGNILIIPLPSKESRLKFSVLKENLLKNSDIIGVSGTLEPPSDRLLDYGSIRADGMRVTSEIEEPTAPVLSVDSDFFSLLNIPLLAGRSLSTSSSESTEFILNRKAVQSLGWSSPEDAIGKTIYWRQMQGHVVGVCENFHFSSLHYQIENLVILRNPQWILQALIKVNSSDLEGTIRNVNQIWHRVHPQEPFSYAFLDDLFFEQYFKDRQQSYALLLFAILTVFVACLGLFGLTTLLTEKRSKEFAIRKVLGADALSLVWLVAKNFLTLLVFSLAIASAVAYWGMNQWLQNFAYRVSIDFLTFAKSGAIVLILIFSTIAIQSSRVASRSPSKALQSD